MVGWLQSVANGQPLVTQSNLGICNKLKNLWYVNVKQGQNKYIYFIQFQKLLTFRNLHFCDMVVLKIFK